MDFINFNNKAYPLRAVFLPAFGDVLISTTSLNLKLMDDSGGYTSNDANTIDERIFYFVDDNEINLPEKTLKELLLKQIR